MRNPFSKGVRIVPEALSSPGTSSSPSRKHLKKEICDASRRLSTVATYLENPDADNLPEITCLPGWFAAAPPIAVSKECDNRGVSALGAGNTPTYRYPREFGN